MKALAINELFYSLQGEGARAGSANVFVRFQACNLQCDVEPGPLSPGGFACDTEFASGRLRTPEELLEDMGQLVPATGVGVILTGGEPSLQVEPDLVEALKANGWGPICMETNGTTDVSELDLDWVTLSPKVAEHAVKVRRANEVKYVRALGQGIPRPSAERTFSYISPAFSGNRLDPETLAWCVSLVKENPPWRLSVQQHKAWGVR